MATKLFVILSSADREVALEVGLVYPLNAARNKWMEDVKLISLAHRKRPLPPTRKSRKGSRSYRRPASR